MQAPEQHNSTLIKILSWQHSYTHIIKNTFTVIHYSSICTHTGVHSSPTRSYWCALITHSLILVCTHHPLAHTGVHSSPTRSYWCALITHSYCTRTVYSTTHHPLILYSYCVQYYSSPTAHICYFWQYHCAHIYLYSGPLPAHCSPPTQPPRLAHCLPTLHIRWDSSLSRTIDIIPFRKVW